MAQPPLPGIAGYDMVYGVSQNTINLQFKYLHATFIPGTKTTYIPQTIDTRPAPDKPGLWGKLEAPYIGIDIGTDTNFKNARFFFPITNGNVVYRDENDDLQTITFKSWTLSFLVNIAKTEITPQNIDSIPITDAVKAQIKALPSDVFQPYSLFLDLANANIITSLQVSGVDWNSVDAVVREEVTVRLTFYFSNLKTTNNPYIVGYPVHSKDPAVTDPLPFFAPTDIRFSTTANPTTSGLSTINYLVTTNNRVPPTDPTAGILRQPLELAGGEGISLISSDLFVNQYIVGIFLNAVKAALRVPESFSAVTPVSWTLTHTVPETRTVVGKDSGIADIFVLTNQSTTCSGSLSSQNDQVVLTLNGQFSIQLDWKEDWGVGDVPLASLQRQQPFTITLAFSGGTAGRIDVTVSVVKGTPIAPDPSLSDIAKVSDFISGLVNLKGVGDATSYSEGQVTILEDAQLNLLSTNISEAVNVLSKRVILPAGDVFSVSSLHLDASNNLVSSVTYNDGPPTLSNKPKLQAPPAAPAPPAQQPQQSPYSTTVEIPLNATRKLTNPLEVRKATLAKLDAALKAGLPAPTSFVTEVQDSIQAVVSSELMYQKISATPLDPAQRLQALQDNVENPILFSIGTDNLFYATYFSPPPPLPIGTLVSNINSSAQWTPVQIMPNAKGLEKASAQAFAAVQNPDDGTIYLVIAITTDADKINGDSRLFVSKPLPNDVTKVNWATFGSSWVERPRPTALQSQKIPVDHIYLGSPGANGNATPLLILSTKTVTGSDHRFATHYLVDADAANTVPDTLWTEYRLPNDAVTILDLAVGNHPIGDVPDSGFETRGTYALYKTAGGDTVLNFTTLLDPTFNQSFHFQMSVPVDTRAIYAVASGDSGYTDVYVGGASQLGVFPSSNQLSGSTATPVATVSNVGEISVSYSGKTASIWALDAGNALWRIESNGLPSDNTPISWSTPLIIRTDIAQIAPLYNRSQNVQELVLLNAKSNQASHLVRDASTTLWNDRLLPVKSLDKLLTFPTYTTQIRASDPVGRSLNGETVLLSADQFVSIVVNGEAYNVGQTPVSISTGATGKITIIQAVTSIESPYISLLFSNAVSTLIVNPSAAVTDKLFSVKTTDDLQNAKDSLGRPVFAGVNQDGLSVAASVINQLSVHQPQSNPRAFLASTPPPSFNPLAAASWGLSFRNGSSTFVSGPQLKTLALSAKLAGSDNPLGSFGDFCEWALHGLEEVLEMTVEVVEGVLTIAATIAGEVIKFVIKTVVELVKAAAVLVGKILGINVDGFLAWLGALFDWDEIVRTGKCIEHVVNIAIEQVEAQLQSFEPIIRQRFGVAKDALRSVKPEVPQNSFLQKPINIQPDLSQYGDEVLKIASYVTDNPVVHFIEDKILNNGLISAFEGNLTLGPLPDLSQIIADFFTKVVEPAVSEIFKDGETLFNDLFSLVQTSGDNLSLPQILEVVGIDILILILDAAENIVVAFLELTTDILKVLSAFINGHFDIPFFSALAKDLIGSDLSIAGLLALAVAIPLHTVLSGLTGISQVFPPGFESSSWDQLQKLFNSAPNSTASATPALGADPDPNDDPINNLHAAFPVVSAFCSSLYDALTAYSLIREQEATKDEDKPGTFLLALIAVCGAFSFGFSVPDASGTLPSNEPTYGLQWANTILKGFDTAKSILLATSLFLKDEADPFPVPTAALEVGIGILNIIFTLSTLPLPDKINTLPASQDIWVGDGCFDGISIGLAGTLRFAVFQKVDPEVCGFMYAGSVGTALLSVALSLIASVSYALKN